ncbi:MAG: ABC transporter ATP-binding protein [Niameybacter sp.]
MSYFIADHVAKSYDGRQIIEDITIQVEKGELVALLGVSGIGKTTLFNILSGLETPDEGQVLLKGEVVTSQTGYASYMQQKDLLLPYKKVIDNVSLPLILKGISKKQAREQAQIHFEYFGLKGMEYKYPHQLSGGMRQRAALLRSYLFSSKLMLLDEPFSALDAITKHQIHDWYLEIVEQMQTTSLFITHDIDEAILLADKIYIMSGIPGRITKVFDLKSGKHQGCKLTTNDFTTSEQFITYKKQILQAIQ